MTGGIIIDEYDTRRFNLACVHVTNLYAFEFAVNDMFLSFLISISVFPFTVWSIISSSLEIELLDP